MIKILPFLGSGPDRGRGPVEWGDFPSFLPSVRRSVGPSVRQSVSPSVRQSLSPSVRPSVGPSVRPLLFWKDENRAF